MDEGRVLDALESKLSAVQEDFRDIRGDMADIRRNVNDSRGAMLQHLTWHLGEAS